MKQKIKEKSSLLLVLKPIPVSMTHNHDIKETVKLHNFKLIKIKTISTAFYNKESLTLPRDPKLKDTVYKVPKAIISSRLNHPSKSPNNILAQLCPRPYNHHMFPILPLSQQIPTILDIALIGLVKITSTLIAPKKLIFIKLSIKELRLPPIHHQDPVMAAVLSEIQMTGNTLPPILLPTHFCSLILIFQALYL